VSLEMCFWLVGDEQLARFRQRRGAFLLSLNSLAPKERS